MIRFYLTEEPILPNVPTYICARPDGSGLRPRPSGRAGGQGGQRIGRLRHAHGAVVHREPSASEFRDKIQANPRNYIAQPVVTLSTCPTWTDEGLARGTSICGPTSSAARSTWVLPGGLTRTALVKGSLVVNSSQGGGSKDTWVMERRYTELISAASPSIVSG